MDNSTPLVRFDQIAEMISERIDPSEAEVERYVGLEHLDPETLQIKRWGVPSDVKGTKLRFYESDIIFGKRRAYQRKLAVADFEGICSAHAMVLRARPDACLPEFLPFFMQSEMFFERALAISVGSLSPTINWKTLARQEFPLPPIDEQRRIAEILWAADEAVEKQDELREEVQKNQVRLSISLMNSGLFKNGKKEVEAASPFQTKRITRKIPQDWKIHKLSEVIKSADNGFASGDRDENGIVQLRMNNISRRGRFIWEDITRVPEDAANIEKYLLTPGDIVFNNTNSEDLVGKSAYFEGYSEDLVFSNHFTRIRVKPKLLLPKYLSFWLRSKFFIGLFLHRCQRWVGQAAVQRDNLLQLEILIPPIDEQVEIIKILESLEQQFISISSHIEILMETKKALMEKLVSSYMR
jgi:type I restriction enzyme, S subunit